MQSVGLMREAKQPSDAFDVNVGRKPKQLSFSVTKRVSRNPDLCLTRLDRQQFLKRIELDRGWNSEHLTALQGALPALVECLLLLLYAR